METVIFSEETEKYFLAQRSLILSNGDTEFQDKTDHDPDLVGDLIETYSQVVIAPMLARVEK
jgi:hypothetical protein